MSQDDRQLVLVAHGSRDPRWQKPFEEFAARMQEKYGTDRVTLSYMEMCEPRMMDVIETSIASGKHHFVILPLFMAAGGHVSKDLPHQAMAVLDKHPEVTIQMLSPIGETHEVREAMASLVDQWHQRPEKYIGEIIEKASSS